MGERISEGLGTWTMHLIIICKVFWVWPVYWPRTEGARAVDRNNNQELGGKVHAARSQQLDESRKQTMIDPAIAVLTLPSPFHFPFPSHPPRSLPFPRLSSLYISLYFFISLYLFWFRVRLLPHSRLFGLVFGIPKSRCCIFLRYIFLCRYELIFDIQVQSSS